MINLKKLLPKDRSPYQRKFKALNANARFLLDISPLRPSDVKAIICDDNTTAE